MQTQWPSQLATGVRLTFLGNQPWAEPHLHLGLRSLRRPPWRSHSAGLDEREGACLREGGRTAAKELVVLDDGRCGRVWEDKTFAVRPQVAHKLDQAPRASGQSSGELPSGNLTKGQG